MDFQECIEVKVLLGKPFFSNHSAWLSHFAFVFLSLLSLQMQLSQGTFSALVSQSSM